MIGYKEQGETDGLRTKLPTEGAREEISYRGVLHLKIFLQHPVGQLSYPGMRTCYCVTGRLYSSRTHSSLSRGLTRS